MGDEQVSATTLFLFITVHYFDEFTFRLPNTPVGHSEALAPGEGYGICSSKNRGILDTGWEGKTCQEVYGIVLSEKI